MQLLPLSDVQMTISVSLSLVTQLRVVQLINFAKLLKPSTRLVSPQTRQMLKLALEESLFERWLFTL